MIQQPLGKCPREMELSLQRHLQPRVYWNSMHNSQRNRKSTGVYHWWMDKEWVVHKHKGILFSHKKEWNTAQYINIIEMEAIMQSEISQAQEVHTKRP